MLGSRYTNLTLFRHDFVMADKFPKWGLNMNVGNDKRAVWCDIIKEQPCGAWDVPRHADGYSNIAEFFLYFPCLVYDIFLDVPSVAINDNFSWSSLWMMWTMIGQGQTCSAATPLTQTRQKSMILRFLSLIRWPSWKTLMLCSLTCVILPISYDICEEIFV